MEISLHLLLGAQDQRLGAQHYQLPCGSTGTSCSKCQETETCMSLACDMSHATTASPKPSFRVPWRVGDAVVGRGHARWTTSKSGHRCPCHNCTHGRSAEDLCWIVPHVPRRPNRSRDWTDYFSYCSFLNTNLSSLRQTVTLRHRMISIANCYIQTCSRFCHLSRDCLRGQEKEEWKCLIRRTLKP